MSSKELPRWHQSFLEHYATPEKHYSFEEAPAAYLKNPDHYATEEQLNQAVESWNPDVVNAAAQYRGELKPHHIDKLLDHPMVRSMSKNIMLNQPGITTENLTHAWNNFKEPPLGLDDGSTSIYGMHRILRHAKVSHEVIKDAINHPANVISSFAREEAKLRKLHHLL